MNADATIRFEPSGRERAPRPGGSRMLLRRTGAMITDWFLALLLAAGIGALGSLVGIWPAGVNGSYGTLTDQLLFLACIILVTVPFSIRTGQTPGKRLCGLGVSSTDPIRVLLREVCKYLPLTLLLLQPAAGWLLVYYPVAYAMAWHRPGWSAHDLLLGTTVYRQRKNQTSGAVVE
jgi:uncharacterized RDD family membrane protein YckC